MSTKNGRADPEPTVTPTSEVIHIEKTRNVCPVCEEYAK